MENVYEVVLTQEDLDAAPYLVGRGAQVGDVLTVTRPAKVEEEQTSKGGNDAGVASTDSTEKTDEEAAA